MTAITLSDARKSFDTLIDQVVNQHEQICISENGIPLVLVSPASQDAPDPFARHPMIMGVKIKCDLSAPLSDEDWPEASRCDQIIPQYPGVKVSW